MSLKLHKTKQGLQIKISDMTDDHLKATIRLIEDQSKKGIKVQVGGGNYAEDIWYDEEIIYDIDALDEMRYSDYVNEYNSRVRNKSKGKY
jgi:hypothetical protein